MKYIQSFYQYPVTLSSIGKTIPARSAQGELRNIMEISEKELEKVQNAEPLFRELVDKKKFRVLNHLPSSYVPSAQRINEAQNEAEQLRKELEAAKAKIAELEAEGSTATDSSETETEDNTDSDESSKSETESDTEDLESLSYEELKEKATSLGIEYKGNVSKAALIKLIEEAEAE